MLQAIEVRCNVDSDLKWNKYRKCDYCANYHDAQIIDATFYFTMIFRLMALF